MWLLFVFICMSSDFMFPWYGDLLGCKKLLCPLLCFSFSPLPIPLLPPVPLSCRPKLLKLPASSCCYEPRGFSAALWGRSHALPKRKKGRKTAITISEPQKKWEGEACLVLPCVSPQHLHEHFCPFNTKQFGKNVSLFRIMVGNFFCFLDKSFLFSSEVVGWLRWWENWKQNHPQWKWVSPAFSGVLTLEMAGIGGLLVLGGQMKLLGVIRNKHKSVNLFKFSA